MSNEEFKKACHYNFVAHAVRTVDSHAIEWEDKELSHIGRFDAQKTKEKLYDLKAFGLIYLLKNNAADFWGLDAYNYLKVRTSAGIAGYVVHTKWTHRPSELKDVEFNDDNVENIFTILDADDEYGDHCLNTPESIRFLQHLERGEEWAGAPAREAGKTLPWQEGE